MSSNILRFKYDDPCLWIEFEIEQYPNECELQLYLQSRKGLEIGNIPECFLVDIQQAIQLRNFLNKFIGDNNE